MTNQQRLLLEFFSDATSPEAQAFAVTNAEDEAFVETTLRDIDDRVNALSFMPDAPHALRVLAHQAKLLWQGKLARKEVA